MRFRLLSDEELKHLEAEFKQFLIVNQIHSDEWLKLNNSEPEKVLMLVELFSDTVLLKVYEKIQFLEFRSPSLFSVYKFSEENIQAIHLKTENDSISLVDDNNLKTAIRNNLSELTLFKAEKNVNPFKEDEIHQLILQGCIVSNEFVWSQMASMSAST